MKKYKVTLTQEECAELDPISSMILSILNS
jgi:hypothetical protein